MRPDPLWQNRNVSKWNLKAWRENVSMSWHWCWVALLTKGQPCQKTSLAKRKSSIRALSRLTKKNEKCIETSLGEQFCVGHWTAVDPRSLTRQLAPSRIASHMLNLWKIHSTIHLIQVKEIHLLEQWTEWSQAKVSSKNLPMFSAHSIRDQGLEE